MTQPVTIRACMGDWPPCKGDHAIWRELPISDAELAAAREKLDLDEVYILDIQSDPQIEGLNCAPFDDVHAINQAAEKLQTFSPEQMQAVSAFCQYGEGLCEAVQNVENGAYRFLACAEEPEGSGVYIQTEDGYVRLHVPQS